MARTSTIKRRRYAKTKRSKSKFVNAIHTVVQVKSEQSNVSIYTATYPCTIAGLRWCFGLCPYDLSSTSGSNFIWAIYVVEQGDTPKSLNLGSLNVTPASEAFKGEATVIAWGSGIVIGNNIVNFDSSTKSMRKLQGGDQLMLSMKYNTANGEAAPEDIAGVIMQGAIQYFTLV